VQPVVGPLPPIIIPPGPVGSLPVPEAPPLGPTNAGAKSGTPGGTRITEIVPPVGNIARTALERDSSPERPPIAADASASADPCVNVFVRSAKVDGREVVSVDLHGDSLIKGAVPPHLASDLLARARPATDPNGARAACVSPALAQSLFTPVVNVAAVDPAVKMARVGERWRLAGSREALKVVEPQPPLQLAAAKTTRGAAKPTPKKKGTPAASTARAGPAKPGSARTSAQPAPNPAAASAQQLASVSFP
jgi:hypothetical protein